MNLSLRERVLLLLQNKTQKQAASILGISERTIRRVKNVEGYDTRVSKKTESIIQSQSNNIIKKATSKRRSKDTESKLEWGRRRDLRNYKTVRGKRLWDGSYRRSDWITYNVSFMSPRAILSLMVDIKKKYRQQKYLLAMFFVDSVKDGIRKRHGLRQFDILSYDVDDMYEEIEYSLSLYEAARIASFSILVPV